MGFFDDLVKNAALWGIVQASKDENGKPDPYKAAGIAAGMGNFSFSDSARLGAMLGSQGAFDTNTDDNYSVTSRYGGADNSWKDFCEDGEEYDVDSEDYDSEEEYEEALMEAKYSWQDECEDSTDHGIDSDDYDLEEEYGENEENTGITLSFSMSCPALDKLNAIKREDYPNERRYQAAYTLANEFQVYSDGEREKKEKKRCRFIVEDADHILAAIFPIIMDFCMRRQ